MGIRKDSSDMSGSLTDTETGVTYEADSPTAPEGVVASESPADERLNDPAENHEDYADGLMKAVSEAAGEVEDADDDESENEGLESGEKDPDQSEDDDNESEEDSDRKDAEGEEKAEKLPPFHEHPRWQEMVRERNSWREQVESLKPFADEYQRIQQFMQENELDANEVAEAIRTAALMKSNPAKAREALSREMEKLDSFTGHKLPPDLQADVEDGMISAEHARELARLRNQQQHTSAQFERHRQQTEQQQRQERAQNVLKEQQQAVAAWETDLKQRDPDYARIQPWVFKELRLLVAENPPTSRDQAVTMAKQAYENVRSELRKITGRREQKVPGPSSSQSSVSSGAQGKPESFMDAVMQAAGHVNEG
jgi:hypothetical protein